MFGKIHHVSYLVHDLDTTIDWYVKMFEAEFTGKGTVPTLGDVGFVQAGDVEVEFIQPEDRSLLDSQGSFVFHHVAYVVDDLDRSVADFRARGYSFANPEPFTNFMGYRLIYFDPSCTNGTRVHLTEASSLRR